MDRDQEKFYEDEVRPQVDIHDIEDSETVDDMQYFLELLKHMRVTVETGTNVPLTNKKVIDAEMCLRILDDIEHNLPDAIQYGLQMYQERDRILGNAEQQAMNRVSSAEMRANAALSKAREEAERVLADAESEARAILADAQERADHMVEESEITYRANEEARITRNDARVEAGEIKLKASHDAYQVLTKVEEELTSSLSVIRRRRAELDGAAE